MHIYVPKLHEVLTVQHIIHFCVGPGYPHLRPTSYLQNPECILSMRDDLLFWKSFPQVVTVLTHNLNVKVGERREARVLQHVGDEMP